MRAAALRLLEIVALEQHGLSAGPVQASLRMGGTIALQSEQRAGSAATCRSAGPCP